MKFKTLLFLLCLCIFNTVSAYDIVIDGLRYSTYETTASVSGYVNDSIEVIIEVIIPSSITYKGKTYDVTSIGGHAFNGCKSLISVVIPESVSSIENSAFQGCSNLSTINLPSNLESINHSEFNGCTSLTSITIPASITSIYYDAFAGCSNLKEIIFLDGDDHLSVYDDPFADCPLEKLYIGRDISYSYSKLPFDSISSLTSVTFGEGITKIPDDYFSGCSNLSSVTFSTSITSIGNRSFSGCSSLTEITPTNVTSIGSGAFKGCINLKTLNHPNFVLDNLALFNKQKTKLLGYYDDSSTSYEIPSTVMAIADYTFADCEKLTSIAIPEDVKLIGDGAFQDCSGLIAIKIPESVTSIGRSAFFGCSGLTSLNIPKNVTYIGSSTFYECFSLTSINIPEGVTEISSNAFHNCSGLTSISIPESVTAIGWSTFKGCSGLKSIYCNNKTPCSTYDESFDNDTKVNAVLYVPEGSSGDYMLADGWSEFFNIEEFAADNIQSISMNKKVDVYNLHGVKVANKLSMEEIQNTLLKGIYIVNNKIISIP